VLGFLLIDSQEEYITIRSKFSFTNKEV